MTGAAPAERRAHLTVALVGRPNAGKTSLLMQLTGSIQHPVNFPGSSVERVEGRLHLDHTVLTAVDLPGISSLQPVSPDERVALAYLEGAEGRRPDLLCAVLDASKLSVELQLVSELTELGLPIVLALNKNDVARAGGRGVDPVALAKATGLPVVETDGRGKRGLQELARQLVEAAGGAPASPLPASADAIATGLQAARAPRRSRSATVDAWLLHRVLGLPILALLVFGIFELVYAGAQPFMDAITSVQGVLSLGVEALLGPGALRSFLIDGLINGVGSVLVFLPQIVLLVGLISLLEGSGYMARAAFLLDRPLSRVGLSGRSFVPLASAFACAIPAILSSRIIEDERDRIATIVVAPLMSCSARLPVYVVLVGAFFPLAWAGLVLFGLYLLGIGLAVLVAWTLRRTVLRGGRSMLLMELPVYQRPSLKVVFGQTWLASSQFLTLAGTIILGSSILIWVFSYYPRPAAIHESFAAQRLQIQQQVEEPSQRALRLERVWRSEKAAYLEQSFLARVGRGIQPLFAPAGFDWRTTVGLLAAFPARELIIPTYGILFGLGDIDPKSFDLTELVQGDDTQGLRERLRSARRPDGLPAFNSLIALSLMVFFALCSQCISTLSAIRRETRSWRWPLFTFSYMTSLAWIAAVTVYQVGSLLGYGIEP